MEFAEGFNNAIHDYYELLKNKYPQKSILKLVGDRYKLSGTERSMLYRGVSTDGENKFRSRKLIFEKLVQNQVLHVDGFNQILTIASYLNGSQVFISTDHLLRDASEIHGKIFRTELLERSVNYIFEYCGSLKLNQLIFYIDQQVSDHKKLFEVLSNRSSEYNFDNELIISDKVDERLKELTTGIIATSDSQIINKSKQKIFDLAFHTLKFHFSPNFLDLNSLVIKKQ